jgi:hypothetical protein
MLLHRRLPSSLDPDSRQHPSLTEGSDHDSRRELARVSRLSPPPYVYLRLPYDSILLVEFERVRKPSWDEFYVPFRMKEQRRLVALIYLALSYVWGHSEPS